MGRDSEFARSFCQLQIGGDYTDTALCGDVKNASGAVQPKFIKAVEKLMKKYEINHIHLYWGKFK